MPSETDLYFPVGDARYEAQFMSTVSLVPIPSIWGHPAGAGANPEDRNFLNQTIRRFSQADRKELAKKESAGRSLACRHSRQVVASSMTRRAVALVLSVLMVATRTHVSEAQRFSALQGDPATPNLPYDGRFTFARLRYTVASGGYYYRGLPAWAHGYAHAEENLLAITHEVSVLDARRDRIERAGNR